MFAHNRRREKNLYTRMGVKSDIYDCLVNLKNKMVYHVGDSVEE